MEQRKKITWGDIKVFKKILDEMSIPSWEDKVQNYMVQNGLILCVEFRGLLFPSLNDPILKMMAEDKNGPLVIHHRKTNLQAPQIKYPNVV